MSSTPIQPLNGNPRKKRRLNNNLATTDRMHVMVGIEKRKVSKLKQEVSEAMIAKDAALKELGQIKSDTISQIKKKNKEINDVQDKMKTIYHQNEELKQKETTLIHKLEIFEAQIDSMQKENLKLRSKENDNDTDALILNGHKPTENKLRKNELNALKKEIKLKNNTISSQNEEILRLESQIKEMDANNIGNIDSLKSASRHIQRLQKQIKEKTQNQSDLAESQMEDIRASFERKMRLLQNSVNDYKRDNLKLKVITEEYDVICDKYNELKKKYVDLMELNTKYETVYNELNEWKDIIRSMCLTLFEGDNEYLLENEYQLKIALKNMNEKYIILIKERDEYRCNMMSIKTAYTQCNKELLEIKTDHSSQVRQKENALKRTESISKELNEAQIESKSYKNILNTYNAMTPSKNDQQQQIKSLFEENNRLMQRIKTMEIANKRLDQNLEQIEIENVKLTQRVNNGEYNSLNTKVLNMIDNPLKLAQDKLKNSDKNKVKEYKEKIADLENKLRINVNNKDINNNNNNNAEWMLNDKYYELENQYNILVKKMAIKEQEISGIRNELSSSNKMNQRIKTLFGAKAGEYRERIYQMTGYNICLLGDAKHYRLQHLWSDDRDDEIVLQIDKLGQLQLKDTNFIRNKIDKTLLNKLRKTRSLPIFLSELTLWLYRDHHNIMNN